MGTTPRVCKDCLADEKTYDEWAGQSGYGNQYDPGPPPVKPPATVRPAPNPGPRCATHWREFRRRQKAARHEAYVAKTYSLEQREYEKLYEGQNGTCAICQRATGATRKLSVDHDHKCCPGGISCGYCVRGLLCRPCNDMLGHLRDDWRAAARIINYLLNPPAHAILDKKRPDVTEQRVAETRSGKRPHVLPPSAGPGDARGEAPELH